MRFLLSRKTFVIVILACFVLVSGCGTPIKNVSLPPDFTAQKGTIGVIAITTIDSHKGIAEFYPFIAGGGILPTLVVYGREKQLVDILHKEEIAPIVKKYYPNLFRDGFSREGFKVKTVDTVYDHKNLTKLEKGKLMKASDEVMYYSTIYDLKSISDELQADYLMVLEIHRFGVKRYYYGIAPKTPPFAWTALRCTLIDTASNKVIADHFSEKPILIEEWDEPPNFAKLMKAVSTSFKRAIDDVFTGFLGRAPLEEKGQLEVERIGFEKEKQKLKADKKALEEKQKLAYIPKSVKKIKVKLRTEPKFIHIGGIKKLLAKYQFFERSLNMNGNFTNDFVDNGDGTIVDTVTNLMWQKEGSPRRLSYEEAKLFVGQLNKEKYAGYSAWRIPTIEELASVINKIKIDDLYINPVFEKRQTRCWTLDSCSTDYPNLLQGAWIANFKTGNIDKAMWPQGVDYWSSVYIKFDTNYVRAVRSVE